MATPEILPPVMPSIPSNMKYDMDIYRDTSGKVLGVFMNGQPIGRIVSVQQMLEQGKLVATITTEIDRVVTNPDGFAPSPEDFVIGVPENVSAQVGATYIVLEWDPPISGDITITGYQVSIASLKAKGATDLWRPASSMNGHTFTDLTTGVPYAIKVRATTNVGYGEAAETTVTPVPIGGVPSEPRNLTVTSGDSQATLSWTAPLSDGQAAIQGYEVSSDNGTTWAPAFGMTGHTFTGLDNGTTYVLSVRAWNTNGKGETASKPATPQSAPTVPSAPTNLITVPTSSQITLSWSEPADVGGNPIQYYEVSKDAGVSWLNATNPSMHVFEGLDADTEYTLQVRGVNAIGEGIAAGAVVSTLPAGIVVEPVTNVQLSTDETDVILSWSKVEGPDAAAIERYEIRAQLTADPADEQYLVLEDALTVTDESVNLSELFTEFFNLNPTGITSDDYYLVVVSDPTAIEDTPAYAVTSATVAVEVTEGVGVEVSL